MEGKELLQKLLQYKENELSLQDKLLRFVLSCESKNRFIPVAKLPNLLNELLQYGRESSLQKSSAYYRARIHDEIQNYNNTEPLDYKEARPLDAKNNSGGRFNPSGFSYLYLSNNEETAIYETKPHPFSYITIFKGQLKKDIKIIDFSEFIPPLNLLLASASSGQKKENEVKIFVTFLLSRPIMPSLGNILYSPTQYIADFIKSKNYDGICFRSSLKIDGKNFVLFDVDVVDFENCERKIAQVESIKIDFKFV
jgi:hypothetical protein